MKICLLVVGKTNDALIEQLTDRYVSRLRHYVPFDIEVIPELKNTKAMTPDVQKVREGELILKAVSPADHVVLLDEGGKEWRSVEFAAYLDRLQTAPARRLVFVVGGPYGFSSAVYAAAREKLSLSRMTFSHQMVRLFFVEQCYRAMTILRGEPYHHE